MRNSIRQLQRLVYAAEDAAHIPQDLYVLYVDFTCAFNTVDHSKLLRIMLDLGFPPEAVAVIKDLYDGASSIWGYTACADSAGHHSG